MREAVKAHRLTVFFVLAFVLSWYPCAIALARGRTTGPNPLGPLVAALIVTAVVSGGRGVRELLSRLIRWRIGVKWYAVVFFVPIAAALIAAALTLGVSRAPFSMPADVRAGDLIERFIFILLFIGLGEEPGWRGFALQELQRNRTPLAASLILAPIWALWHLPLMGTEFKPAIIPAFLIGLLGTTLFQTWLYNRTNGSVLPQMLLHSTVNTIGAGFIFRLFSGSTFIAFWYVYAALWLALGIGSIATFQLTAARRDQQLA